MTGALGRDRLVEAGDALELGMAEPGMMEPGMMELGIAGMALPRLRLSAGFGIRKDLYPGPKLNLKADFIILD